MHDDEHAPLITRGRVSKRNSRGGRRGGELFVGATLAGSPSGEALVAWCLGLQTPEDRLTTGSQTGCVTSSPIMYATRVHFKTSVEIEEVRDTRGDPLDLPQRRVSF